MEGRDQAAASLLRRGMADDGEAGALGVDDVDLVLAGKLGDAPGDVEAGHRIAAGQFHLDRLHPEARQLMHRHNRGLIGDERLAATCRYRAGIFQRKARTTTGIEMRHQLQHRWRLSIQGRGSVKRRRGNGVD